MSKFLVASDLASALPFQPVIATQNRNSATAKAIPTTPMRNESPSFEPRRIRSNRLRRSLDNGPSMPESRRANLIQTPVPA